MARHQTQVQTAPPMAMLFFKLISLWALGLVCILFSSNHSAIIVIVMIKHCQRHNRPRLLSHKLELFLQLKQIQIPASALYSRIQHIGDHIPHLVHLPVFLLVQYHEYHRTMTIISVLCDRRHANDY